MGQMDKLVDYTDEWTATVKVSRGQKVLVNTNGRGYSEDNRVVSEEGSVLSVTLRASDPEKLADKVGIVLGTVEKDN